jgi:Uma2 family endonuclease
MNVIAPPPVRMSVAEFLEWEPGDGRFWQLVDGVPEPMAPTVRTPAAVQNEIGRLLGNHLVDHPAGCSVLANPGIQPRVNAGFNVRIPDVVVVRGGYTEEERLLTTPVIAIEVLSESNELETRSNVWTYTSIPSLAEIVVFRTDAIGAELLRRGADGHWPAEPEVVTDGDLVLDSIGFRAPLAAFYRTTRLA